MITDQALRDIEDHLIPQMKLDPWERSIYYHLLRHTRLDGLESRLFSIEALAASTAISDVKVRDVVRSLHAKGCLAIEDRSRKGHLLRVVLPAEVPGVKLGGPTESAPADITTVDFFTGRQHLQALLQREGFKCFYCLRAVTAESAVLDHVAARMEGLDNSFRNIVVSCHSCNAEKQATGADDFLRILYRKGRLSPSELEERLGTLEQLRTGMLVPKL